MALGKGMGLEVTLKLGPAGSLSSPSRTMGFLPTRGVCSRSCPTMHHFALSPWGPRSPDLRESLLPCLHQELLCWQLRTKRPTPPCHCSHPFICPVPGCTPSLGLPFPWGPLGGWAARVPRERLHQAQALIPKQSSLLYFRTSERFCLSTFNTGHLPM